MAISTDALFVALASLAAGSILAAVLGAFALRDRTPAAPDTARHRGHGRSWSLRYEPRRAAIYHGRHEDAAHGPVVLGAHPDGGLALVHADLPAEPAVATRLADEPTVEWPQLAGVGA